MAGLSITHLYDKRYSTPIIEPIIIRQNQVRNGEEFLLVGSATEKAHAHMRQHYPSQTDPLEEFVHAAVEQVGASCQEYLSKGANPDFVMIITLLEFEPERDEKTKLASTFRINVVTIMEFQAAGLATFFCFVHPDEVEAFELEHTPRTQNEKLH